MERSERGTLRFSERSPLCVKSQYPPSLFAEGPWIGSNKGARRGQDLLRKSADDEDDARLGNHETRIYRA